MAERQKRWLLALTIVLVFGLLLGAPFVRPRAAFSAPPAQEQPGEDVYLDYGDDVTKTLYAEDESEVFETFVFRVHVPAGAELTVWLGEDAQGGCYSEGLLFVDGSQVGYTTVGPAPSSWSDPIIATVSTGYAQLAFRGYDDCDASVTFPVEKYVRFKVGSPPSPEIQFWADRDHIGLGECTTLHWQTENVQAVYYQGEGVSGDGDRQECPLQTTTYELYVVIYQAAEQLVDETRYVTIYVEPTPTPTYTLTPSPTRTPTRTPTGTPTRTQTPTRTPTGTPTRTQTPTRTPTATPTARTPTATRHATGTPTRTPIPTRAPAATVAPRWIAPPAPSQTAPPWVLVVTHSDALETQLQCTTDPPCGCPAPPRGSNQWVTIEGWLRGRYGEDNIDVLDLHQEEGVDRLNCFTIDAAIEARKETYTGLPNFILIIGGADVVPLCGVPNPMGDRDVLVFTDDLYGDFDHDFLNLPDVPTARLPDGGDLELYREQFSLPQGRTHHGWGSAMVIANVERPYGHDFATLIGTVVQWSLPVDLGHANRYPAIRTGHNAYFILHGKDDDPSEWTGEDPVGKYPPAWNAAWAQGAHSQGTVISGACYGAFIGFPCDPNFPLNAFPLNHPVRVADSIALTYLRNGAEAFMGHTAGHWSHETTYKLKVCWGWPFENVCSWEEELTEWLVDEGAQAIEWFAFSEIANGRHPLVAYFRSKAMLANTLDSVPDSKRKELKALHSFVYYGLPPAP